VIFAPQFARAVESTWKTASSAAEAAAVDELVLDAPAFPLRVAAVAAVEEGVEDHAGVYEVEVFGRDRHGVLAVTVFGLEAIGLTLPNSNPIDT